MSRFKINLEKCVIYFKIRRNVSRKMHIICTTKIKSVLKILKI